MEVTTFSCMKITNSAWQCSSMGSEGGLLGNKLRENALLWPWKWEIHGKLMEMSPLRHHLDLKAINSVSHVRELCWFQSFCLTTCWEMGLIRRKYINFQAEKLLWWNFPWVEIYTIYIKKDKNISWHLCIGCCGSSRRMVEKHYQ